MRQAHEISDRPYLDSKRLSDECEQIIHKHFRELHVRDWPHTRAILSKGSDADFCIHFPDSKENIVCGAVPEIAAELLRHFEDLTHLRILLWGNLPETMFAELLQALTTRNLRLLCRHEHHAVVEFVKESGREVKKAA